MKTNSTPLVFTTLLLLFSQLSFAQIQVGQKIIDIASPILGWSMDISYDGTIVVAGNPYFDSDGNGFFTEGKVQVFRLENGLWRQMGPPIFGTMNFNNAGWSASLSDDGQRLAFSSINITNPGDWTGAMSVLEFNGTDWESVGGLMGGGNVLGGGEFADIEFSLDGSTVAGVGRHVDYISNEYNSQVYIYEYVDDRWKVKGAEDFGLGGSFAALSADGNRIAIGYQLEELAVTQIRVFDFINGAWQPNVGNFFVEEIIHSNIDRVKFSFGKNGDRLALGYPTADGLEVGSGLAKVFNFNGTNWSAMGDPIIGVEGHYNIGSTLELSTDGNRILVDSRRDSLHLGPQELLVYEWNGIEWKHLAKGSSIGGGLNKFSGDGKSMIRWEQGGLAIYSQFGPNCTNWVDTETEWHHTLYPEGAGAGYSHTILDTAYFSDMLQAAIYNYRDIAYYQDPLDCTIDTTEIEGIETWVKDSTVYLNGDTIACFKQGIASWTYTQNWNWGLVTDYHFTRKNDQEEIFGNENLKGYLFDLEYETEGGNPVQLEDLSFYEKIGFTQARLDFYRTYFPGVGPNYEVRCVNYAGNEVIALNGFSNPDCDFLPSCLPLNTIDNTLSASIQIFPNPTTDRIYWMSDVSNIELINIQDNLGRSIPGFDRGINYVDLRNTTPGIYFLSFKIGDRVVVEKIVKE